VPSTVGPARPPRNKSVPSNFGAFGDDVAFLDDDLRAEIAHAFQMKINGPRANHAPAGQ
jgi:hypothetical protein